MMGTIRIRTQIVGDKYIKAKLYRTGLKNVTNDDLIVKNASYYLEFDHALF